MTNPIRARLATIKTVYTLDNERRLVMIDADDFDWMRRQMESSIAANERAMKRINGGDSLDSEMIFEIGEDIADALGDGSE